MKGDYLKKSKSREAISSWVRFLKKLGVKARIHVQRINVKINEVCWGLLRPVNSNHNPLLVYFN